jgi:hypothetical protein
MAPPAFLNFIITNFNRKSIDYFLQIPIRENGSKPSCIDEPFLTSKSGFLFPLTIGFEGMNNSTELNGVSRASPWSPTYADKLKEV